MLGASPAGEVAQNVGPAPFTPSVGRGSQRMTICFFFYPGSPYVAQAGLELTNIHKLLGTRLSQAT